MAYQPVASTRNPVRWLAAAVGVAWILGIACGEGAQPPWSTVDSAGVEIVTSHANAWSAGEAWTIGPEPIVSIGTIEGDSVYELFGAASATRLADGTIVIGNAGTRELRFFDASGVYLRSVGREGDGPGEFRGLSGVAVFADDSLLVLDGGLKRISVFTLEGDFARSARIADVEMMGSLSLEGQFEDGALLVSQFFPKLQSTAPPGLRRDRVPYVMFGTEGDSVGAFLLPDRDRHWRSMEGGGLMFGSPLFARVTYTAVAGRSLFVGDNEDYVIDQYDRDGRIVRSVRRQVDPTLVSDAIFQAEQEQIIQSMPEERRARSRSDQNDRPRPPALPFYSAIEVDAEGYLWVKEFASRSRPDLDWSVFDPDGRLLGQVTMPDGLTVYEIGPDHVLGRWRDEVDVEYIRLYSLDRRTN